MGNAVMYNKVHAFISSRLDYCKSSGWHMRQCNEETAVSQKCCCSLITNTRKFDHIPPVLRNLHTTSVYRMERRGGVHRAMSELPGRSPLYSKPASRRATTTTTSSSSSSSSRVNKTTTTIRRASERRASVSRHRRKRVEHKAQ